MNHNHVTVVIINWNGYDDTVECVRSVLNIQYSPYSILIIDNGSRNNEAQKLSRLFRKNKQITVVRNKENLGFSEGVNIGLQYSIDMHSEYTLLLNNDTIVDPSFLGELVTVMSNDNHIGISAPNIYYYDRPNEIWASGVYFNYYFPPLSAAYSGNIPEKVNDVVGCCMLIRNAILDEVGLFDTDYFAYGEESDFNFRVHKQTKYTLYSVPSAKVYHKISRSTGGGFNKIVAYYKMRNKIIFAKKNYPWHFWPSYALFLLLYFLKEQMRAVLAARWDVSASLMKGAKDGI